MVTVKLSSGRFGRRENGKPRVGRNCTKLDVELMIPWPEKYVCLLTHTHTYVIVALGSLFINSKGRHVELGTTDRLARTQAGMGEGRRRVLLMDRCVFAVHIMQGAVSLRAVGVCT